MKNGHLPHFFVWLLSRCHWRFVLHSQDHLQVTQNCLSHTISTEGFLLHSSSLLLFVFLTYFSCFRYLAALWHVFYPTRIIFCITLTYEINLSSRRNRNIFKYKCDDTLVPFMLLGVHSLQNLWSRLNHVFWSAKYSVVLKYMVQRDFSIYPLLIKAIKKRNIDKVNKFCCNVTVHVC